MAVLHGISDSREAGLDLDLDGFGSGFELGVFVPRHEIEPATIRPFGHFHTQFAQLAQVPHLFILLEEVGWVGLVEECAHG